MLDLVFNRGPAAAYQVLCLGAHSDDIEIGCGGTLLHWLAAYARVSVHWVVLGCRETRAAEAQASAHAFLEHAAGKTVVTRDFRDGYFPFQGAEIKDYFEQLKSEVQPDVIFTHTRHDAHQDHRLVCDLTWNTFRDHLILEYEIPKYDGDLGTPNVYMPLEERVCQTKIDYLMRFFGTQRSRRWFTEDTFWALLRLRGVETQMRHAEAFYGRKLMLGAGPR